MNNQKEDFEEILKDADSALRRAALKAKHEAERNGTLMWWQKLKATMRYNK